MIEINDHHRTNPFDLHLGLKLFLRLLRRTFGSISIICSQFLSGFIVPDRWKNNNLLFAIYNRQVEHYFSILYSYSFLFRQTPTSFIFLEIVQKLHSQPRTRTNCENDKRALASHNYYMLSMIVGVVFQEIEFFKLEKNSAYAHIFLFIGCPHQNYVNGNSMIYHLLLTKNFVVGMSNNWLSGTKRNIQTFYF